MNRKIMALIIFMIGLACIAVAAFLFLTPKTKEPKDNSVSTDRYKKQGSKFENYVIQKMASIDGVKLLSKNSDYYHNGIGAADNVHPDLKFSYKDTPFAVECKWRSQFKSDKIFWAKDYQIANYNKFQQEQGIQVFVAIGVGGSPNHPEQLYFIPLYRLKYSTAHKGYIEEFEISEKKSMISLLKH